MKKIVPGVGNRAKRYRKPCDNLTGAGKRIRRRGSKKKTKPKKNGRKRNKRQTK